MAGCKTITRYLPATFAWFILFTTTGLFFASPCQYLQNTYHYSITIVQALIVLFVIANLFLATFMDPGVIPKASPDEDNEDDFRAPLYKSVDINGITVRVKWCVTCQFYRPPRCSHCSVCNTCIETFDHHCPWVNNCIGRRNYRHFFFFLISLSIHMITSFTWCLIYILDHPDQLHERDSIISMVLIGVIIITFIPIIGLAGFHVVLVARGRTTNEQVTGKFQTGYNPFTRGCVSNCCFILCGPQHNRYQSTKKRKPHSKHLKKKFNSLTPSARYDNSMKVYIDEGNVLLFPKSSATVNNANSSNLDNVNKKVEPSFRYSPIYRTDKAPVSFNSRIENAIENQSKDCEPSPPSSPTKLNSLNSISLSSPSSRAYQKVYKTPDNKNYVYTSNVINYGRLTPTSSDPNKLGHILSPHNHNYSITMQKTENGKTETTFPVTESTTTPRNVQSGHQRLYSSNPSSKINYNPDQTTSHDQQSHSNQTTTVANDTSSKGQSYSSQTKPFYNNPQPGGMVIYYSPDAGGYSRKSDTECEKPSLMKENDDKKANHLFNNDNDSELSETRSNQSFIKRPMSFIKALEMSDKLEKQANSRQSGNTKGGDEARQSQYEMNYEISV